MSESAVKLVLRLFRFVALAAIALVSPAQAATEIMWWHAMSGELGRSWRSSRPISTPRNPTTGSLPTYKGNYTETVTAAIFAFRSRSQPAIVQVNEIATATMMAAKGAIYPVFELMRDQSEPFSPAAYLPAVAGYYSDVAGNMLSFPFNASTPILYYNKDLFRDAGSRSGSGAENLARGRGRGEAAARGRRGLRPDHLLAVLDPCREFLGIP